MHSRKTPAAGNVGMIDFDCDQAAPTEVGATRTADHAASCTTTGDENGAGGDGDPQICLIGADVGHSRSTTPASRTGSLVLRLARTGRPGHPADAADAAPREAWQDSADL